MKAGRYAASCIAQALSRSHRAGIDRAMSEYPHMLRDEYGGYYQLGRIFVALIENPTIMRTCTNVGLPIPRLMTLVHKLLSDGYERSGGRLRRPTHHHADQGGASRMTTTTHNREER